MRARRHRGDHLKWLAESPQCRRTPCVCNKRTAKTYFGLSPVLMAAHLKVALQCTRGLRPACRLCPARKRSAASGVFCANAKGGIDLASALCGLLPRLVGPCGCGGPNTRTDNRSCKPKAVSIAILVGYDRFVLADRGRCGHAVAAPTALKRPPRWQVFSCRVPSRLPIGSFSLVE